MWFVILKRFKIIHLFINNLCKDNYLKMKILIGEMVLTPNENSQSEETKPTHYIESMINIANNMINLCLTEKSSNPWFEVTENSEFLNSTLTPIMETLNELIEGPCKRNINIVLHHDVHLNCYSLIQKITDDLEHEFYELKLQLVKYINIIVTYVEIDHKFMNNKIFYSI